MGDFEWDFGIQKNQKIPKISPKKTPSKHKTTFHTRKYLKIL
jgi:hypothetical protein